MYAGVREQFDAGARERARADIDEADTTDNIRKARAHLRDAEEQGSESSTLLAIGYALLAISESLARAYPVLDTSRWPNTASPNTSATRPPEHGAAAKLALWIHKDGTQSRQDVDRHFDRLPVSMDQILQYAAAKRWLVDHGSRVTRGDLEPSLEDLASPWLYRAPVPEPVPAEA